MGLLGDMLEVLYGPPAPPDTIRATIRHWRDLDLAERAGDAGRTVRGRRKPRAQAPAPRVAEVSLSVWTSPPSRVRMEERRQAEGRTEESLLVADGENWWMRQPEGQIVTGGPQRERPPGLINLERHFDHATLRQFFEHLALESLGGARAAGRDCLRLRATPRLNGHLWPHWLPHGADEYEFHADPGRAVLLSIIGRHGGEVFEVAEVTEVAFGEALADDLFAYRPQPDVPVRPAVPVAEHLTLEAAARRMPFAVLLPTGLPELESARQDVIYHPPRGCSPWEHLALMYRDGSGWDRFWLYESAGPNPELGEYEWEQVERGGQALLISDPGAGVRERGVVLERHGTHVTIWSDMERERLLDLAATLSPAPGVEGR